MTGYQEVLTDPSYYGQIVTMTAPRDRQRRRQPRGHRGRRRTRRASRASSCATRARSRRTGAPSESLDAYLARHGVVGDRRASTRASSRATCATTARRTAPSAPTSPEALAAARARGARHERPRPRAAPSRRKERYAWTEGRGAWADGAAPRPREHHVVVDRLRHQAQHPALPGRRRLPGHRRPGHRRPPTTSSR